MLIVLRTQWHNAAVGGHEAKDAYCSAPDKRRHYYHTFNALIERCKGSGPHLIGNSNSFADAVLFALLWGE